MDPSDILQERLDQNYQDYVAGLRGRTADELIELAPVITAARQLRDELACACSSETAEVLLQFDDPLEEMRGFWADQQDVSHSEEIGHMICELQNRGLIPEKAIVPPPVKPGQDKAKTSRIRPKRDRER